MRKQLWILGLLFGTALPIFAAQPMAGMEMQEKSAQVSHQGMGKVVSVDRAKASIKLEHEAIKSLGWPGMTMDFSVSKAALLDGLKAGDAVMFELGKDARSGKWQINRIAPQGTHSR